MVQPNGKKGFNMRPRSTSLRRRPERTSENSPAFQRREHGRSQTSPEGTTEPLQVFSAVPSGLEASAFVPGIEMLGYFQMFLWNRPSCERGANLEMRSPFTAEVW